LWAYLAGVCQKQRVFVHEIGGMEDHLHMLIEIPLSLSLSDAMQEIKTSSSRWIDDGQPVRMATRDSASSA
jgi:putative transposase